MKKKSAALIFALFIISVVAIFAFTAARSIIAGISRTTRAGDAMIAEEAAKGGIEWGLLWYKNQPGTSCLGDGCTLAPCTLNFDTSTCSGIISNKNNAKIYADIRGNKECHMYMGDPVCTGHVYSIGEIGGVYKGLQATGAGVLGDYTEEENEPPTVDLNGPFDITWPVNYVTLSGSGSTDPEGQPLTYTFESLTPGDITFTPWPPPPAPSQPFLRHVTFNTEPPSSDPVVYNLRLTVSDGELSATATTTVTLRLPSVVPITKIIRPKSDISGYTGWAEEPIGTDYTTVNELDPYNIMNYLGSTGLAGAEDRFNYTTLSPVSRITQLAVRFYFQGKPSGAGQPFGTMDVNLYIGGWRTAQPHTCVTTSGATPERATFTYTPPPGTYWTKPQLDALQTSIKKTNFQPCKVIQMWVKVTYFE